LASLAESGVVIANEPTKIADQIARLFIDPAWRAALSKSGKMSVESQYSWNQTLRPFSRLVSKINR